MQSTAIILCLLLNHAVLDPTNDNSTYIELVGSRFELRCETFDLSGAVSWRKVDGRYTVSNL